jgi:hypothetical protein
VFFFKAGHPALKKIEPLKRYFRHYFSDMCLFETFPLPEGHWRFSLAGYAADEKAFNQSYADRSASGGLIRVIREIRAK